MRGLQTIIFLFISNTFMTFAWYGHLRFKDKLAWNHLVGFGLLIAAVFLFLKNGNTFSQLSEITFDLHGLARL